MLGHIRLEEQYHGHHRNMKQEWGAWERGDDRLMIFEIPEPRGKTPATLYNRLEKQNGLYQVNNLSIEVFSWLTETEHD